MGWFNQLKLQTKLLIAFSVIILSAALSIGWFLYTLSTVTMQNEALIETSNELMSVIEVQGLLRRQQQAVSDYLVTGESRYLEVFQESAHVSREIVARTLIDAEANESRDVLTQIDAELAEYHKDFEPIIELSQQGETDAALEAARQFAEIQEEHLIGLHEEIDRFVYRRRLGLDSTAEANRGILRGTFLFGAVALLVLCILGVAASLLANGIAEPILHLTSAIVAFENNAYDEEMLEDYVKRDEEVGRLAQAVDSMAQSITTATRTKDQFLTAASRFVPNAYLEFLQKPSITDIRLGDHVSAEMAVMFSDIRSFSTISERMTPQQNFDFVNDYLQRVSPIIQQHHGFVVKFLGDGMMAVFPYDVEDAIKAGLDKLSMVVRYNGERQLKNDIGIDLGIGIHTGHMMVGMIGEEGRMQGDAFSDNVNLTARIEGLNKFFGTSLIISAETRSRLEDPNKFSMRLLGRVQVKGRETPITLYEVLNCEYQAIDAVKWQLKDQYEQAVKMYWIGKFNESRSLLEDVLRLNAHDKSAAYYYDQIAHYASAGTPDYWDGVIVMTAK